MDNQSATRATIGGSGGVGFLGALVAVFLAGAISGALASLLNVYRLIWGEAGTLLLTTFASILIGAVAIKVILGFMGADVSLTVAAVTMIIGNLLSVAISVAQVSAQRHVNHSNTVVLPFVGASVSALAVLVSIAVLLGQALIIQNFATARS